MKSSIKIMILSIVVVIMLTAGLMFAMNYKKQTTKHFVASGYVINNIHELDDSVNKEYFDANASYSLTKTDSYTFKNTDGKNVTVDSESFVHYSNGDIMSLKNGVAIDLNEVNSKLLKYYNVFSNTLLKKASNGYELSSLDNAIFFDKLMYKISNNKYLIASNNIIVNLPNNKVTMNDYIEIEYADNNIIKIYNDEANYQTIASDVTIVIDNVSIDLGNKVISYNGKKYMTMADMVINLEDDIEKLPIEVNIEDNDDGNDKKDDEQNKNEDDSELLKKLQEQLNNVTLPDVNEKLDDDKVVTQPKVTVVSMDVTTFGFDNLLLLAEDEDGTLYGDKKIEIVETSSGKTVQYFDWQEEMQSYSIASFADLRPNTTYSLNVSGKYKIEDTVYDKIFVSKVFRTLDIGLEVMTDYVTSDSLSFAVYRNKNSNISAFVYNITDEKGNVVVDDTQKVYNGNLDYVVFSEREKFDPNTKYILTIKNMQYGNVAYLTSDIEYAKIVYGVKTLKEKPNLDIDLDWEFDSVKNTIKFFANGITDKNGGIKKYKFNLYEELEGSREEIYSTIKDTYSDLELPISKIDGYKKLTFDVEMEFDDNEKTIIYSSGLSDLIQLDDIEYPHVSGYNSVDLSTINAETLSGVITLTDSKSFIKSNRISKYKVILKKKNGLSNAVQQYDATLDFIENSISSIEQNQNILLPVKFKDLDPNTKYLLYVYLNYSDGDDENYIYIGNVVAETKEMEPLKLTIENLESDPDAEDEENSNLFAFDVTLEAGTSVELLKVMYFKLFGCNGNECSELSERVVPKDTESNELELLKNLDTLTIKSSEFDNLDISSALGYETLKIQVAAETKNYKLDNSDKKEININNTNKNEFILEKFDIPPKVSIDISSVLKRDCKGEGSCPDYYENNGGLTDDIKTDTIVGYNFIIESDRNPADSSKKVNNFYYSIYEGDCESDPTNAEYRFIELTRASEVIFEPVASSEGNGKIKRGGKYCLAYYWSYADNSKTSSVHYKELNPKKQAARISGYVKDYDGEYVTFKFDSLNDIDKSISRFYAMIGNHELEQDILNDDEYKFKISQSGNKALKLMAEEQLTSNEDLKDFVLYTAYLDEIVTLQNNILIYVDTTSQGKVTLKLPYGDYSDLPENSNEPFTVLDESYKSRIAGVLVNGKKFDLKEEPGNYLETVINVSDLNVNDNSEVNLSDLRLLYDDGMIVNYKNGEDTQEFFIEINNDSLVETLYFKRINELLELSKISVNSIFNAAPSEMKIFTFSSIPLEEEDSTIGRGLKLTNSSLFNLVHFKKIEKSTVKLFDTNKDFINDNIVEVDRLISTSKIETFYGYNEAAIRFDFDESETAVNGLEIKINLLENDDINFDGEEATFIYQYGESSNKTFNNNTIIDSVEIDENGQVTVNFENLDNKNYSYEILYKNRENEYSKTYNKFTQSVNTNLTISPLRELEFYDYNVQYEKKYWNWNNNTNDIYFKKELKTHFNVENNYFLDASKNDKIIYSIVAKLNDEDEGIEISTNDYLSENNSFYSNTLSNPEKLNLFDGNYSIEIKSKICRGENNSNCRNLVSKTIGYVEILKTNPDIAVTNTNTVFSMFLNDKNGVLNPCNMENLDSLEIDEELKTNLNNIKLNDPIKNVSLDEEYADYFSTNAANKVYYFSLYKGNRFVGYVDIPFVNQTSRFDLKNELSDGGWATGEDYNAKIIYCTTNGIFSEKFDLNKITIVEKLPITVSDLGGIILIEIKEEYSGKDYSDRINRINHIEYSYTKSNGVPVNGYISNNDLQGENNVTLYRRERTDGAEYLIVLSLETDSVSNLTLGFYDASQGILNKELIAQYN